LKRKNHNIYILGIVLMVSLLMLTGCTGQMAGSPGGQALGPTPESEPKQKKLVIGDFIEEHTVSTNKVYIHKAVFRGNDGFLFTAQDQNGKIINNLFYNMNNENDKTLYNDFKQMDERGKRRFIYRRFRKIHNIDLRSSEPKQKRLVIGDFIEEYTFGTNKVYVNKAVFRGNDGILFTAHDQNGKDINNLFYNMNDENDEKLYNDFKQMDEQGKKRFIYIRFKKIHNIDLGSGE